jgi:hypothetical protein
LVLEVQVLMLEVQEMDQTLRLALLHLQVEEMEALVLEVQVVHVEERVLQVRDLTLQAVVVMEALEQVGLTLLELVG